MKYTFFYEITTTGTKRQDTIEANNFRIARNKFFELNKDLAYYKIDAVHEIDRDGNLINIYH